MPEHDDLTPPPDEPIPAHTRARIRAELVAAAQAQPPASRWLVPGVAAAAVLLVAGLAGWAVQAGGGDSGGAGPAGGSGGGSAIPTAPAPSTAATSATPTPPPSQLRASRKPDGTVRAVPHPPSHASSSCRDEVTAVLPGAAEAMTVTDDDGRSSFWTAHGRFVLCDDRAGTVTVHHPHPLAAAEKVETYRVSSIYPPATSPYNTVRVAGGIVPGGATAYDVRYTFPDGHTERATTTTDDQGRTWWRMVYAYDERAGSEPDLPPIEVTASYSGVQHSYQLTWGVDTCAQANHGC